MSVEPARNTELSPAKRRQILAGARQAFAALGYGRATVDRIAARAGVSKATLYNHFHDKDALFVAAFSEEVEELRDGLRACLGEPSGDVGQALRCIGQKIVELTLSPAVECLYRQTIAEAGRFPEIGRMLFERGPKVVQEAIAAYLRRWAERGVLRVDDAWSAAVQLGVLCQGDLHLRSQLGIRARPEEVRETVERGVRTFLRAYGVASVAEAPPAGAGGAR